MSLSFVDRKNFGCRETIKKGYGWPGCGDLNEN